MKTTLKIIQYKDGKWGAKKLGWFGWKYLGISSNYVWRYSIFWPFASYTKKDSKEEVLGLLQHVFHYYPRSSKWACTEI